jgi:hypothetical protein
MSDQIGSQKKKSIFESKNTNLSVRERLVRVFLHFQSGGSNLEWHGPIMWRRGKTRARAHKLQKSLPVDRRHFGQNGPEILNVIGVRLHVLVYRMALKNPNIHIALATEESLRLKSAVRNTGKKRIHKKIEKKMPQ